MNLRTQNNTYIARMQNVPIGAMCRHTGYVRMHNGHHRPSRFEQDKDMIVYNRGSYQQEGAKDVIFGCNDLVEVFKSRHRS
jgi:hypothetical protein